MAPFSMNPRVVRPRALAALLLTALLLALPARLHAQALGTITGTVADAATNGAVVDAKVSVRGRPVPVATDSSGTFTMANVAPGTLVLQVRALGYASAARIIDVHAGDTTHVDLALAKVTTLQEVVVQEHKPMPSKRFVDFEQRRRTGRGSYFDREEIEKSHASNLMDLLRSARGVRSECSGSTCLIKMVSAAPGCFPEYYVDGRLNEYFGPTTPIRDLEAVEVYNGPAETPAEFQGGGGCGTVVIWTKSTP